MLCLICNNKIRMKVRPDTILENFPLFCPKCKQETIISAIGQNAVAVNKPKKQYEGAIVKEIIRKHKAVTAIVIVALCAALLFIGYYFPLQRVLAGVKLDEYMELQGVDTADIESIEYHKDTKQDGYSVFIRYRDDEYLYVYRYYLFSTGQGDSMQYNTMFCDVYDSNNTCMENYVEGMKYKSLEWDNYENAD